MDIKTPGLIDHASSHIDGGADELDGDKIAITWTPSNYVRDSTTPSEADSDDDLTAHLQGIDTAIGGATGAPDGSDTTIQFNDGGSAFGGEDNFTFNKSTETLTLSGPGIFALTGYATGNTVTLSDAASITVDASAGTNFIVTLGGNRTLANPSNLAAGQSGVFIIVQDGTGSRTLAFGSYYFFSGGIAPTMTTTAASIDMIPYFVKSTTEILCTFIPAMATTT